MYPETDMPPVSVTRQMLDNASSKAPRPWDEIIRLLETKYSLNTALATKIFDSDYMSLFEDILQNTSTLQPTFVAAKLTEDLTSLERRGLDSSVLPKDTIKDIFVRLDRGDISRESVVQLYEVLMKKEAASVDEAIKKLGLTSISDAELSKALDSVLKEHSDAVKERGIASMGMLMGRAMVMLKGKADGQRISNMLKEKLDKIIVQDRR
jgi:glutamyl-tRNA(Gln) amidotransferase subunit E